MKKTNKFVLTSLFASLVFIATLFFNINLPNGYANLGDCFIIAGACLLGYKYGACAAAIGASLSDIALGYVVYAPATFVIKALMAVICALIYMHTKGRVRLAISAFAAECVMVLGYFFYECLLYGIGGASLSVVGNTIQGIVNIAAAIVLMVFLNRYVSSYFNNIDKK